MSEMVKINDASECLACKTIPIPEQVVQCFVCKSHYHATCDSAAKEYHLGTKTMVKTFLAESTKSNFKLLCDVCLTEYERNLVETQNEKITALTEKVANMESKLDVITKLLKSPDSVKPEVRKPVVKTCWDDTEKLSQIKAPKPKPQLVIKKSNDENQNRIEETMIQNKIQIAESFKNREGDLVVVCDTDEECQTVKQLVTTTSEDTLVRTPKEKHPSITIVGFTKEYTKDEIMQMLVLQNGFIKGFASSNDIKEHIEIFSVRPLKSNNGCYQAFAGVSPTLREGIKHFKDKLTLGFTNCKVYDRYHIKRCNNCQHFGHYSRECPTPDEHVCGKCSQNHLTDDCSSADVKCVNCVREKGDQCEHTAFDFKCPSLKKKQETEKKKQMKRILNYSLIHQHHLK